MELRYWGPVYELIVVNTGKQKFIVLGHEGYEEVKHLRHLVKNLHPKNTVTTVLAYDFEDMLETLEYQELRANIHVLDEIAAFDAIKRF